MARINAMLLRRFRLRFTLLGLLAFTALSALATQGYLVWEKHRAYKRFQWAQSVFDVGAELEDGSIISEYCWASERLCINECAVPLANRAAAKRDHLDRISYVQRRVDAMLDCSCPGSMRPTPDELLIRQYRERAEKMVADLTR
jgi:hypothetical protein